jgi:hypothetical protein
MCLIMGLPDVTSVSSDPGTIADPGTARRCSPVRRDAINIDFFQRNKAPGLNPNIVKRIPGGVTTFPGIDSNSYQKWDISNKNRKLNV